MSFSTEQKLDIYSQPIKSNCCKKAMLYGIIAPKATVSDGMILTGLGDRAAADYLIKLTREIYSKNADSKFVRRGGRGAVVGFSSNSALHYLSDLDSGGELFVEKCPMCQASFLRGLFISSGRITDPTKQYLLEFSVKERRELIISYFEELGLVPRVSVKPHEEVIYFKNSSAIEDFFALAGMNQTTFALMNAKIQGEIRNNVNRIANCETNNITKAVSASSEVIGIISELSRKGLISQLPDELQKTAILRMEHSDLSLSQLAAIITPYISKPGLSHRLKKISELGKELLSKSKR